MAQKGRNNPRIYRSMNGGANHGLSTPGDTIQPRKGVQPDTSHSAEELMLSHKAPHVVGPHF